MSAERDAGLAAMQSGDTNTAIQQLELATQQNPGDYQTAMYLGAAYGQAQRHADAVGALTRAVQIEPANAQARYNLGIAMEQGGWTEQAKQAYEQALTLQPDYAKAQEALGRTQALLSQQQPTVDPMNMPTTALSPQQTGYTPNQPTQQMPAQPQPMYAPPTQQQPPPYGQPQQPAYGAPPPSPYGTPVPPAYGAPPSPYPQPGGNYPVQTQHHPDSFSIKDALLDWKEIVFSPRAFWQRQADSEGFSAPSAMNITYIIALLLISGIITVIKDPSAIVALAFGLVIVGLILTAMMFAFTFVFGGLVHGVGKLFGNSAGYAGSYRVVTYALAPFFALMLLMALLTAPFNTAPKLGSGAFGSNSSRTIPRDASGQPDFVALANQSSGQSDTVSTLSAVVMIGGLIWSVVTMGMGIAHVQRISTGGAIGTLILGFIIPWIVVVIVLSILFAALIVAALGAMR